MELSTIIILLCNYSHKYQTFFLSVCRIFAVLLGELKTVMLDQKHDLTTIELVFYILSTF